MDCNGNWVGPGTECTANLCLEGPRGACCDPNSGICTLTLQRECHPPDNWLGPSIYCTPDPCSIATGACCLNSYCVVVSRSDCYLYWGRYLGNGLSCDPNPCLPASSIESPPANPSLENLTTLPNPSTGKVEIVYRVAKAGPVTVEIFDAAGKAVRRFAEGRQAAGSHAVRWDGRDGRGAPVPRGVYLTRFETAVGVMTEKVVLSR